MWHPQYPWSPSMWRSSLRDNRKLDILFPNLSAPEESSLKSESLHSLCKVRGYRDRLLGIQVLENELNNGRLRLEYLRFLAATASSNLMLWQNLRYDDLRRLKRAPENATSAWLGSAYRNAPRSLSMDAAAWTRWDTPVTPWTTWTASWREGTTRLAPLPDIANLPVQRRWRDRMLGKCKQRTHAPTPVSVFRRTHPYRRSRSSKLEKRPTPHQGRFIEHLNENWGFRDILSSKHRQGTWRKDKRKDGTNVGTLVSKRSFSGSKRKMKVNINERECDKDEAPVEQRKRRSIMSTRLKSVFGSWL